ncbi:protein required for asparagine-linked oligosaccharide assembly [Scheffersomyces amazonensis]|uniref:protein required for asparagine-linked oligosaccharide assembly n=1 Tax=Scheffersomyces amazonensis TaxID=1078765 RepID=UPI00315D5C48
MYLILVVLVLVYLVYLVITTALPHHFLIPSQHWKDKILKVLNHPTPIYLKVGSKRSSFRRRLVLASVQPSFYTNFINNKLKIQPEDSKNENNQFINQMSKRDINDTNRKLLYGFFHPYANNGGGGERVLWESVKATLLADDRNIAIIYTTNTDVEPLNILENVSKKFQINNLDSKRILFIYLRRFNNLIDGAYWKHFSLIGQLIGSILLALEAMQELSPDVWIDTMGLPGSYLPVSLILKIPILAYVHYPIIQPEMFNKLKFKSLKLSEFTQFSWLNPRDYIALGKLIYWSLLYWFYAFLGSRVDITLANGTWTHNHLESIWVFNRAFGNQLEILYPPCGTESLSSESESESNPPQSRLNKLLYVAQFRPEKRHSLILKEYSQFLKKNFPNVSQPNSSIPTIVFLGSCRTPDDTSTLTLLKSEVEQLQLSNFVEFVVDQPYSEVIHWLSISKFGLNAMWNEHFGIGVVEYLARGVIPLVHASAGPYLDIVTGWNDENKEEAWRNNTGFFFKSYDDPDFEPSIQSKEDTEYLTFQDRNDSSILISYPSLSQLFSELFVNQPQLISDTNLEILRSNGIELVKNKFSNHTFDTQWIQYLNNLEGLEKSYREHRRDKVGMVF